MSDSLVSMPLYGNMVTVSTLGLESLGYVGALGASASATYPTANLAMFFPFRVFNPNGIVIVKLVVSNGASILGNIDVGIYDASGTKLVSSGSTAQAGISALQEFDIADTTLGPGVFYLAVAMNNTTGTLTRNSLFVKQSRMLGCLQMATAFPLPATATFATSTNGYLVHMMGTTRTVV